VRTDFLPQPFDLFGITGAVGAFKTLPDFSAQGFVAVNQIINFDSVV
jgi:hypothetical protein